MVPAFRSQRSNTRAERSLLFAVVVVCCWGVVVVIEAVKQSVLHFHTVSKKVNFKQECKSSVKDMHLPITSLARD